MLKRGDHLKLKEDALLHVKTRDWVFENIEDDSVVLMHETGYYGISVKASDIDWQEFKRSERPNCD